MARTPEPRDETDPTPVQLPWESMDDAEGSPVRGRAPDADLAALAAAVEALDASRRPGGAADDSSDDASAGAVHSLDYAELDPPANAPIPGPDSDPDPGAVDYEHPVPAEPLEEDLGPAPRGGGWTVAALCFGIGIIACCVIIPQADANRRLAYERERLQVDLDSIKKQVATNAEFLRRVADDPNLAERLAQRQMRIIREGTRVLELKKNKAGAGGPGRAAGTPAAGATLSGDVSPFHLVAVAPPPPMPPYQPGGGRLAAVCYDPHKRLYLTGFGLLLMAAGLVCGFAAPPKP